MDNILNIELKKLMAFKDKAPSCQTCKFITEWRDQADVERYLCTYNNITTIETTEDSVCKFYEYKTTTS